MSLSITDLKKGTIFKFNNEPFRVIDYSQKVMGRGGSIVNVRIKSLLDGKVLEKTFKGNEQLESADIENRNVQYLYNAGNIYFFMDQKSFEQFEISIIAIGEQAKFLQEGDIVQVQLLDGVPVNIELAKNVAVAVTYTEDVVKGDTASNVMKNAVIATGAQVKVPAFIKQGDLIRVDTRTGSYLERVK
ncbi:MAG TPA: elongation factor P [Patescibacteria group bacterium]|jgi:elongation factor P|nr:elongation factor P [Patescibacteria group bacterium]